MRKIKFQQALSKEEFLNSKELQKIYEPYAPTELSRYKRVMDRFVDVKAFKVDVDPGKNYGRDFKLFSLVTASDGDRVITEVSAISGLTSAPLKRVEINEETQEIIIYDEQCFKNNPEGRGFCRAKGFIITNQYLSV